MLRSVVGRAGAGLRPALAQTSKRAGVCQVRQIHGSAPTRKEEEPLGPSIIEQYKLDDPTRYVPLTLLSGSLATVTGLYHIDGETQLLVLWALFCGTVYSRGGPMIAEMFDEVADQIQAEQTKLEEAEIDAVKVALQAHKNQTGIYEEVKAVFDGQNELLEEIVKSANLRLEAAVRDEVVKKLDTLVTAEQKASDRIRKDLAERAVASVTEAYKGSNGANLKKTALDAALTALSSPEGAKKDPTVGNLYAKFFSDFSKNLKANEGKQLELSKADVASITEELESIKRRDGLDIKIEVPSKATVKLF